MEIIDRAFQLVAKVNAFANRARQFFYQVVLADRDCPDCRSRLVMVREGAFGMCRYHAAIASGVLSAIVTSCRVRPAL